MRAWNHVGVTVSDLDASIAFYEEVVGMTLVRRYPRAADDWFRELTENPAAEVEAAMLALGDVELQLVQYHAGGAPGGTGHAALGGMHICVDVPDVEATHTALGAAGRWHVGPLVARSPYGGLSFYVHDPDGLPVELVGRDA